MKRRFFIIAILFWILLCLSGCSGLPKDSSFSILFIDVGQGDSALIECDGRYMLIDGGDVSAGDKVYKVLEERGIQHLDILAISHLHSDHIGGLIKAVTYASSVDKTISNSDYIETEVFKKLEHQLGINESFISVPNVSDKYELGSALVEVVDVSSTQDNDSLVLMITYGETRFLFTGDIGESAQTRISNKYNDGTDNPYKIDLIKMPHHGAEVGILFLRTFMPDYAVISVGKANKYGHPYPLTLERLEQADVKVFRTDEDGDIFVQSDGKTITVNSH